MPKKSNFIATSDVPDGAYFDFVYNSQNLRILKADLIAIFGTVGALEAIGSVAGTPVLSQSGTTNYIRNLEGGQGVKTSVSPEGGALVALSLAAGSTGIPILLDNADKSTLIRNLVAGSGVSLGLSGDSIQITASDIITASNVVVVNTMADFPTAIDGAITLNGDTAYLVSGYLSTPNRFVFGDNCVIYGADRKIASLTYTGTEVMFTATGGPSIGLATLTFNCPNAAVFNLNGGTRILIDLCDCEECYSLGSLTDVAGFRLDRSTFLNITSDGLSVSGSTQQFIAHGSRLNILAGTLIDLGTSEVTNLQIISVFGTVAAGAVGISGLANSGNIPVGGLATVMMSNIQGAGTILESISPFDARWNFFYNANVPDSANGVLAVHGGSTIAIAAANTPALLGATWVEEGAARFDMTAEGRFTYTGLGANVTISASVTADLVSGVDDCTFYIALNGTVITNSAVRREFDSGDPGNIGLLWGLQITTGDYIEVFCENNDTSVDIIIVNVILRIKD